MAIEELLSQGLAAGFGGETNMQTVNRGGFNVQSSHFVSSDGGIYYDEWAANRLGGGQELVEKDGKRFTRVYAGGTVDEEMLSKMGITGNDIMSYLKQQLTTNGDRIRLYDNFKSEDGKWGYTYEVLERDEESIPITLGKEMIFHNGEVAFIHYFILCPVE